MTAHKVRPGKVRVSEGLRGLQELYAACTWMYTSSHRRTLVVAAAMRVIEMELVLVARMACAGQVCASCAKILVLRSSISGTASMTMSTSPKSSILVEGVNRSRMAVASDWLIFSLETSLERSLSAKAKPLSSDCWEVSTRVTGTPAARAATRAMPKPYIHVYQLSASIA